MSYKAARDKWVSALRSGEYAQGKMSLHSGNEFCCLGVACEIFKEELSIFVNKFPRKDLYSYNQQISFLPKEVNVHLGIAEETDVAFAHMNDRGMTFAQIADFIETLPDVIITDETIAPKLTLPGV